MRARDLRRANNFDVLRLLASIAVLVSHSFALSRHDEPTLGGYTLGTVAVYVFFGISGFLITQSWVAVPNLRVFVVKRVLRLYPALILVLLVAAFVFGPSITTLPVPRYFGSYGTYKYVLVNLSMNTNGFVLPNVFGPPISSGLPMLVNGSIWTLPHEVRAYAVIAVFGVAGILKRRWLAIVAWVAVVAFAATHQIILLGEPDLFRAFATGSLMYLFSDRLPLSLVAATTLIVAWLALSRVSPASSHWLATDTPWFATTAIAYAAITVAHRSPASLRRLTRHGDFSYGIYLWAWPVQQAALTLFPNMTSFETLAISLPVTSALGVASWFLVERTALKLKPRPASPLPAQG